MTTSGYVHCNCRDCFEITLPGEGETLETALCFDCIDAGCEAGAEQECLSEHGYGSDDLCEHGNWLCTETGCRAKE
jgi:hypothetical protein